MLQGCADLQPRALRALSSLTALRLLRLANCHLLDSDPRSHLEVPPGDDALSSISSHGHGLESLDLSGLRRLCDQPLRRLERLTSLVTLHLEGCVGVGRTNEPLGALPTSLTRLCLARCPQLRTGSLANLTSLPSLTALDLRECCGLCDLGRLAACVSLVELDASGCSGLQVCPSAQIDLQMERKLKVGRQLSIKDGRRW